jgi:hypothetical protein
MARWDDFGSVNVIHLRKFSVGVLEPPTEFGDKSHLGEIEFGPRRVALLNAKLGGVQNVRSFESLNAHLPHRGPSGLFSTPIPGPFGIEFLPVLEGEPIRLAFAAPVALDDLAYKLRYR